LPATTTSTVVTIDWNGTRGSDNSDGTLVVDGVPVSGIGSYVVLRNGTAVYTTPGPGNGGSTYTFVDTNGGVGFNYGTTLQYSLRTVDMAGNMATYGPVTTLIQPPITDPGRWDTTIKSASNGPFQLSWASHPGSGITSYNILRSLLQTSGYSVITGTGLGVAFRSWTQPIGTTNASYINTDDTYWYILQSVNGAYTVNSAPVAVILDRMSPNPATIKQLTSPYQPTDYSIPIDITGSGKAVDPGYFGPGDPANMGNPVSVGIAGCNPPA
jgi:hypothetical protein